ncbi:MAG: hypothetical protein ACXVB9_07765 [Bdellovibrionota bacterium]
MKVTLTALLLFGLTGCANLNRAPSSSFCVVDSEDCKDSSSSDHSAESASDPCKATYRPDYCDPTK